MGPVRGTEVSNEVGRRAGVKERRFAGEEKNKKVGVARG